MEHEIDIRKLTTIKDLQEVQKLNEKIWLKDSIPVHQTLTAIKNGGLIIGAYHNQRLIGYSYSFPGFKNEKVYLCSHMLGIDQPYRGKGIGALLKNAQKMEASEMGYSLLTWTYDPLETANATLNLSKLKAISNTYIENCYGEMNDGLNNALPTDRLQVDWYIHSEHLTQFQGNDFDNSRIIAPWTYTVSNLPQLQDRDPMFNEGEKSILLPVPRFFQQMKKDDISLAVDWRYKTRKIFQQAFDRGYAAVSILKDQKEPIQFYVLVEKNRLAIKFE